MSTKNRMSRVNIEQIVARKTKGYAFGPGTHEEKEAFRKSVHTEVTRDYMSMTMAEFFEKYGNWIY